MRPSSLASPHELASPLASSALWKPAGPALPGALFALFSSLSWCLRGKGIVLNLSTKRQLTLVMKYIFNYTSDFLGDNLKSLLLVSDLRRSYSTWLLSAPYDLISTLTLCAKVLNQPQKCGFRTFFIEPLNCPLGILLVSSLYSTETLVINTSVGSTPASGKHKCFPHDLEGPKVGITF